MEQIRNIQKIKSSFLSIFFIILSLSFVRSSWVPSDERVVYSVGINCEKNESFARWINVSAISGGNIEISNFFVVFNSSGNVGNCSLFGQPFYNGSFCCPIDYYCNNTNGVCIKQIRNYCDGLSRENCEGQNSLFFGNLTFFELKLTGWENCGKEMAINNSCVNKTFCECFWRNGKCEQRIRVNMTCFNINDGRIIYSDQKECQFILDSKEDKCADLGKILVKYLAKKVPPTANIECNNLTREYPCSSVVTLPFFNFFNFFISLFFILLIYFLVKINVG